MILLLLLSAVLACPFAALLKGKIDPTILARLHAEHNSNGVNNVEKRSIEEIEQVKVAQTFVLTSRVKTMSSKVFGQGFPVGFAVNGFETPEINLIAGKTYNFTVMSSCAHPFYISFDARGKGRLPVMTGWTGAAPSNSTGARPLCAGKSILFTPGTELIGKFMTYQCFVHDNMGWVLNVKAQSFCDKYTDAKRSVVINNNGLVSAVVDGAFGKLLDPQSPLLEYFDGTIPEGSIDYTDAANAADAGKLANDLVTFFGAALGCTDGSIGPYTGRDMKIVHQRMPIGSAEYDNFVNALAAVLTGFGVSSADLTPVAALLNSADVRGKICNIQADCFESLCNKYSAKDGKGLAFDANKNLITAVVGDVFGRVLADPELKAFFNGTTPAGSTNFFANNAAKTALVNKFVSFLGGPQILSCTDPTFPNTTYAVADLKATHASMPITTRLFDKFNDHVDATLRSLNVSAADITAIRAVLNSTEPLICNQPGCSTVPVSNVATSKVYTINVEKKVAGNPTFGMGFGSGFTVDGAIQVGLTLEVGKSYVFSSNVSCFHPFYITTGQGAGTDEVTEGVKQGAGANICAGSSLIFEPTAAQVGTTLFYGCRNHEFMGARVCVVAAGASTTSPCTASAVVIPPAMMSPCDDLTAKVKASSIGAMYPNSSAIIGKIVFDLFNAGAGYMPDTPAAPLRKFFDGTQPAGSTNFLTNGAELGRLATGLTKFFYTNLGCSDNSNTPYAPGTEPNMKTVHQNMNIDKASFDTFNTVLAGMATNFLGSGVGMDPANLARVGSFLAATSPDICADCADSSPPTLCEKWAAASKTYKGDQKKMIQDVVVGTFMAETATGSESVKFFNGVTPCKSRNFLTDAISRAALVNTLTAFFGSAGVLGCTNSDFPQFVGNADMNEVHQFMPITKAIYDGFVTNLVTVIKGALAADVPTLDKDLEPVAALLYSPSVFAMCNQPDCKTAAGVQSIGTFMTKTCPTKAGTTTVTSAGNGTMTTGGANGSTGSTMTSTPATTTADTTAAGMSTTASSAVAASLTLGAAALAMALQI